MHVLTLASCVYIAKELDPIFLVLITVGINEENERSRKVYNTEYIDVPWEFNASNFIDPHDIAVVMVNNYTIWYIVQLEEKKNYFASVKFDARAKRG